MIDTVKSFVQYGEFEIFNEEKFSPSARGFWTNRGANRCVQNPTRDELDKGNYKPKLTLIKRAIRGGRYMGLIIEFSAPKLIFGNNYNELQDVDFELLISTLQSKLYEMGVVVSKQSLINSQCTKVHFGKNILLKNSSSNLVISTLSKLKIPKRLDNCNTDFSNGGQLFRIHANPFEYVFYNKIKDLQQSKISDKRSIEDDNRVQAHLLDSILLDKEVLRTEVRLNTAKKIKDVLRKCGIEKQSLSLKDIFSKDLSCKVLNHFWNIYIEPSLDVVLLSEETDKELRFRIKAVGFGSHKELKLMGAMNTIKNDGYIALRESMTSRGYYRLLGDLKQISKNSYKRAEVFNDIKNSIEQMYPLRL